MRNRFVFTVALILILLATFAMPVSAATEGSVTGNFSINAPPTITSVTYVPVSMTPQQSQTVSVVVSDPNTINDLSTLVLKIWFDADGGTPTEGEFSAATASAANCAIITWTHTGGTTSTTVITPATTTWALGACTVPTSNPHFSGTSFTFSLVFTTGKVATETIGAALWQIAAKATDSTNQTAWAYDAQGTAMNWYGEISVPVTTMSWGAIPPGTDFTGTGAEKALGTTVTYIANGAFDEKVRSSTTWTGASFTANLDATGVCANAREFALKADDVGVIDAAVLVDTLGVTLDDTGVQTTESGHGVTNYYFWLKLSSTFNIDVYQGTLTFIVANGT